MVGDAPILFRFVVSLGLGLGLRLGLGLGRGSICLYNDFFGIYVDIYEYG